MLVDTHIHLKCKYTEPDRTVLVDLLLNGHQIRKITAHFATHNNGVRVEAY